MINTHNRKHDTGICPWSWYSTEPKTLTSIVKKFKIILEKGNSLFIFIIFSHRKQTANNFQTINWTSEVKTCFEYQISSKQKIYLFFFQHIFFPKYLHCINMSCIFFLYQSNLCWGFKIYVPSLFQHVLIVSTNVCLLGTSHY